MSDLLRLSSQVITFQGDEDNQCHELIESDILVYGSTRHNARGSSKVKLKNIVDYKWETKNYPGHLIAVHMDGKCVAYVIKVSNKVSGSEGMVRVISSGKRALIKGMTGEVLDIQFAHNEKHHILACAEANVLHIYKIDVTSENLVWSTLLEIEDPISNYVPKYDKVAWCPYVPDDSDNDDDANQLIVWARGSCFQCFSLSIVLKIYGNGKHSTENLVEGHLQFVDPSILITWVALSPDGTTLSVGSDDGFIRFYQVYFHEKQPRCLHQWNPHNGKPISSFFFLDNLTKSSAETDHLLFSAYWKYALTGADGNTEFKIWDCGTWDCLQVLSLRSNETDNLRFTADIDMTASYLIVSSIEMNVVYVIQLVNGAIDIDKNKICLEKNEFSSPTYNRDDINSKVTVFMKSISEFPLSSPILSFSIVDATVRKYKYQETDSLLAEDLDDYDDENNSAFCVVIRMFVVQPKSVQECYIIYQPTVTDTADIRSSLSSVGNYADISLEFPQKAEKPIESSSDIGKHLAKTTVVNTCMSPKTTTSKNSNHLNLMTPDSFVVNNDTNNSEPVSNEVLSTILMLANVTNSSNACKKSIENINILNLVKNSVSEYQDQQSHKTVDGQRKSTGNNYEDLCQPTSDRLPSGGSSPSREVQQILAKSPLSQKNSNFYLDTMTSGRESHGSGVKENYVRFENGEPVDIRASKADDASTLPELTNAENIKNFADKSSAEMKDLNAKMDQLINIVQMQSAHLTEMKDEMNVLKKYNIELQENLKRSQFTNETLISKTVGECFIRHEKQSIDRIENLISIRNGHCQDLKESVILILKQFLLDQFPEKQSNLLSVEVQKQITSVVLAKLDVIEHAIQSEISKKLTSTEQIIKENILQLCKSKSFIEMFGEAIAAGVQKGLQNAYIQSMSNTLIPAYEKSSREMFKQLHDTFSLGIKDVIEQFDGYLCQLQPLQEEIKSVSGQVQGFVKHTDSVLAKQNATGIDGFTEIKKDLKSLEISITKSIAETIQKEVRKNFETQAATFEDSVLSVVRSQAHTPAPSLYDVQDQIRYLLYQGQINKAFHQALIANDLVLVEYVLEKADYKNVFNPCVLEQTVLLSLIQQISADMENHNDLKQRYLADAILNLNHNDLITKEHAPRVMKEFCKNCHNFLKSYPKNHLCSNIRMIMMAVQGMGFKVM